MKQILMMIAVLSVAVPAYAGDDAPYVNGTLCSESVKDGDTLMFGAAEIRLQGIDAPEKEQTCTRANGKEWPCGAMASRLMREMVKGRVVRCSLDKRDRYKRIVGFCTRDDGLDINGEMVRTGYAIAYRKYSMVYVPQEEDAAKRKVGLWSGKFQNPHDWRVENYVR